MQNSLLPLIKSLITETYSSYISIDEQVISKLLYQISEQLKKYIKQQQSTLSKELSKKSKQLFVISSDNQSLRQTIMQLENKSTKLLQKLSFKQKQITKLMNDNQRQKREMQQNFNKIISQKNTEINKLQNNITANVSKHKIQLSDLRRLHKDEINKTIQKQQQIAENKINELKKQSIEEKKNIVAIQTKERAELIKKYENKLQKINNQNEQQINKLIKQYEQNKQSDKKIKSNLSNQLTLSENNRKKIQGQLKKQMLGHQKYKQSTELLERQLQQFNVKYKEQIEKLQNQRSTLNSQKKSSQKLLKDKISQLQTKFSQTIKQKDILFQQTMGTLKNQHQIQVQTMKNQFLEIKQIEINSIEVKHYNQVLELNQKGQRYEKQFKKLQAYNKTIRNQYQQKIDKIIKDYQDKIQAIENRNQYQLTLQQKNSKNNIQTLQRKYKLQIKSLKREIQSLTQEFTKKINDQRISVTNKLTSHYQTQINQIKAINQVNVKQKLIEFDRKIKSYEKKLSQGDKRKIQLKVMLDRQKLQYTSKIESLMELNERNQSEIEDLHEQLLKIEKEKSKIFNQFQFKISVKNNQIQSIKDNYSIKQQQLKNILNQKLRIKNIQIKLFNEKIAQQISQIMKSHQKKVKMLQKQYNELKKIMNQKTSLPEDIQALKIFYKGYVKLQEELEKEKKQKNNIQRELISKYSIEKVFMNKTFVMKVQQKDKDKMMSSNVNMFNNINNNNINNKSRPSISTSREFYRNINNQSKSLNKDQKIKKFKSQKL